MIRKARGDVARSTHDAGGNGVANSYRDTESDAENLQELTLFLAGVGGTDRKVRGQRVSGRRQGRSMCAIIVVGGKARGERRARRY